MTITNPTLRRFAETALELQLLLNSTESDQWAPSFSPTPKEQVEIRSHGLVNDPTASIAIDPSRLALREARQTAEAGLKQATDYLVYSTRKLKTAHDYWLGDRPDPKPAAAVA